MPRPRVHSSNADKHRAYRARKDCAKQNYTRLVTAVIASLDAGRSSKFVKGLPEEPNAQCEALVNLLAGKAVVLFPPRK